MLRNLGAIGDIPPRISAYSLHEYNIFIGNNERKRPLGRSKFRWEDNIKISLRKTGIEDVDWINLTMDWDRWKVFVNTVINLQVSLNAANVLTVRFSRTLLYLLLYKLFINVVLFVCFDVYFVFKLTVTARSLLLDIKQKRQVRLSVPHNITQIS